MKVILLERVAGLGNLGDVVEVADGYGRNYLISQGIAKRATKSNLQDFANKKADYESKQQSIIADAKERFERINNQEITIAAKAGVDGKLFGSVTAIDIINELKVSGVVIKKSEVLLPNGTFKVVGDFDVEIDLHHDFKAKLKVRITPEN